MAIRVPKNGHTVLVVDSATIYRMGIISQLNEIPRISKVYEASDGLEAISILQTQTIDMVITELDMPNLNGIGLLKQIQGYGPIKRVVLANKIGLDDLKQCKDFDIHGFLLKKDCLACLQKSVRTIFDGLESSSIDVLELQIKNFTNYKIPQTEPLLSSSEKQMIVMMCQQHENHEIASRLGVSENLVKDHRVNIFEKTGSSNLAGILQFAIERELIEWKKLLGLSI